MNFFKRNLYLFIFAVICVALSIIVVFFHVNGVIDSCMQLIPHILTVASIVLGVISLNLTILISIRDGKLYGWVKEKKPEILDQIYGYAISAIISSAFAIMFSLTILATVELIFRYLFYKYICIFFVSLSFFYMILTTSMSFLQNIQMLRLDDNNKDD